MRRFFILLCILIIPNNCFAQSMYTFDLEKDLIIGSVSLGLAASSLFVNRSGSIASKDDIPLTNSRVNAFDRHLMYEYNSSWDTATDIILYGLMAMPVLSMAGNLGSGTAWTTYGIMYAESALLVFGACELLKNSIVRYRPYCYFDDVPSGKNTDYYKSFPSRHTAFAFMSAGFVTSTFFAEYPDSPWKIPIAAFSYSLAAAVGAGRIFSGSHFLSDVLAGAVLGSVIGYLIPRMYLQKTPDNVTPVPLYNGFGFVWKF